jgi:hypothetical protein
VQLHGHLEEFESRGARLYLIGNGSPNFIDGFREVTGYTGPIYTDPGLKSFDAAGLMRSVRATVGLRSIGAGIRSIKAGRRQGATQGDAWQQGGAMVITPEAKVLYNHRSTAAGDNVSPEELLSALESAS